MDMRIQSKKILAVQTKTEIFSKRNLERNNSIFSENDPGLSFKLPPRKETMKFKANSDLNPILFERYLENYPFIKSVTYFLYHIPKFTQHFTSGDFQNL